MRLAISNIAWDVTEDETVAADLQAEGIDAIDIAPGKYFPDPAKATAHDIENVRKVWKNRGMDIVGMQALLFGTQGLNLFGDATSQERMLDHLGSICRIGDGLGARRLAFGSPKNRDRGSLSGTEATAVATDFFRRAGDRAAKHNVILCLEPNPAVYGCNFMTHTLETAALVRHIAHPAIRMQLDVGTIAINDEPPAATIAACADCIGHIHASDPNLAVLGPHDQLHREAAKAIRQLLPSHIVTIEMLAAKDQPHDQAIRHAVGFTKSIYGGAP